MIIPFYNHHESEHETDGHLVVTGQTTPLKTQQYQKFYLKVGLQRLPSHTRGDQKPSATSWQSRFVVRRCFVPGTIPPTAYPLPSLLSAPLIFLPLRSPFPFTRVRGVWSPEKIWIKYARRRVLEHLKHKNQHLYEPGLLL